jgi:hypothetical protein
MSSAAHRNRITALTAQPVTTKTAKEEVDQASPFNLNQIFYERFFSSSLRLFFKGAFYVCCELR